LALVLLGALFAGGLGRGARAGEALRQGWERFADRSTLQVRTVNARGEEHWSKFWLVVLDGDLYLRLGRRGARRIEQNAAKPFVSVRLGGETFERVRAVAAPEMKERVAKAMAEKYRADIIIRLFPHPLTLRLEREP
jgi:archaeosine-15-forming tRNA-guanine transglycosylase